MLVHKILVDTSFVAKLIGLGGEKEQKKCQNYIIGSVLIAPKLLHYEIGNVFLKYPALDVNLLFEAFENLAIEWHDIKNDRIIFDIARKYKLTFYDAIYFGLLIMHEEIMTFLTYDTDFVKITDPRIKILH